MTEQTRAYSKSDGQTLTALEINTIQDVSISTHWISRPTLRSSGTTNLVAGPTAGLVIDAARLPAITTDTTITVSGLVTNTFYYVYAFNNSGVIGFEYSTTAPDTALRFKAGDTTRVYVGPFNTQTFVSTSIINFFYEKGTYLYQFGSIDGGVYPARLTALSNGTATTNTTIACTGGVPPTTRRAIIEGSTKRTAVGTARQYLEFGPSSSTIREHFIYVPVTNGEYNSKIVTMDLDSESTRQLDYQMQTAATESAGYIGIRGFVENLPA